MLEALLLPDTLLPADPVGNDDVGTLSGSEPMPTPLVDAVCA